jgi:hypothetical protein
MPYGTIVLTYRPVRQRFAETITPAAPCGVPA